LYGSCAKGTNTESSDVDLWVKVKEAKRDHIVELMTELRSKIKNVKVLVLDDERIASLKKKTLYFTIHYVLVQSSFMVKKVRFSIDELLKRA
jgi:predicted nucleotidyltransferase